ncbi:hypothetical protein BLA24_22020 [Streptomyces cinnamoneus]|uniref:Uncharacterized protein n=1 Tax=Streptomyces cinnamoneus TaxID=53446 RepID=A0A2G1XG80_STRCJ|nr:hypothetical protein [Streptomyces cinnamoneus]PHQ50243.1 hypothetical protein BLA24_22020 [Streptomyces cinnamoneus]PPT12972.1 hypothetical protein CYQ11_08765 [Streptomyces cinnamoneus]
MNIRSLTRGDGVVIGAAVLLFIASFLSFHSYDCGPSPIGAMGCPKEPTGWKPDLFPVLPSIFLAGIIAAALVIAARFQPEGRKLVGLSLDQWGIALSVFAAWSSLWTIFGGPDSDRVSPGVGQILALIATLVLAAVSALTPRVPALKAPLLSAPQPAPAPYGAQPGQGYGYPAPGGMQPGAPYGAQQQPSFGGAPQAGPTQVQPQQGPEAAQPAAAGQPAAPAGGDFTPFWFAVPVNRPLFPEDGSQTPIAELAPGTWYLAVDQRGPALVAQTQDGRRGVLQDTTGIQRG